MSYVVLKSFPDFTGYTHQMAGRWVQHLNGRYNKQINDELLAITIVELIKPHWRVTEKNYNMRQIAASACTSFLGSLRQIQLQSAEPVDFGYELNEFLNFFP